MSWRRAGRRELSGILDCLLRDEALCVPFTSRLRAGGRGCDVYFDNDQSTEYLAAVRRGSGGADGAHGARECILHTSHGLLLPVLSPGDEPRHELSELLHGLHPPVHSVMGVGRCVRIVESLLPLPPSTRIEYFLMTLARDSRRASPRPGAKGLRVREAGPSDAEALFPLQRGYELEEVVIDPSSFSDSQCMRSLRRALREELVFVAERDGVPVAKAATNARGFKVDQIGGVYTLPTERGKSLGGLVVSALLDAIFAEKQSACLFVKKRNRSAIALYDRLGFAPVTDYIINYYGPWFRPPASSEAALSAC